METDASSYTFNTALGLRVAGTSITSSTTRAHAGVKSALLTWSTTGIGNYAQTAVTTVVGITYRATAWVYVPTGSPNVRLTDVFNYASPFTSVKDAWVQLTVDFTAIATTTQIGIDQTTSTNGQQCWVDDVQLVSLDARTISVLQIQPYNGGTAVGGVLTVTRTVRPDMTTKWQEYVAEGFTMPASTSNKFRVLATLGAGWNSSDVIEIDDVMMVKRLTLADAILDGPNYSHIEPKFTTFSLINELIFKVLLPNIGDNSNEMTIGPFQEANSISEWGRHSKEYRIHGFGAAPAPAGIAVAGLQALIAEIFTNNAQAKVRVDQLTVPVTDSASLKYAALDVYDVVQVINSTKSVNEYSKISGIRHGISVDRWDIDFVFDDIESVAGSIASSAPPIPVAPYIQSGNNFVTTDVNGIGALTFPIPFINPPIVTLTGGNGESLTFVYSGVAPTATGFSFYAYSQAGGLLASSSVRVFWIAVAQ